jgi:hypothetical protein
MVFASPLCTPSKEDDVPLFRRRRDDESDSELSIDDTSVEPAAQVVAPGRPAGPWDVDDVADDRQRLDLGAVRVPVPDGCEVRVDVQDEQVVAATVVDGRSAIQIHAFAAPRSEGIWDEVRQEIAESLRSGGGAGEEADGPFGRELRARLPMADQAQGQQMQPARFIGVDGPRWFLRGLMTGVAATDPQQARTLEDVFRGVVVVRGGEAMAPRDLLPLRLPREALHNLEGEHLDDAQAVDAEAAPAKPTLDMLERGPEITETR